MTDRCKGQNLVCIHQIEGKKSVMRTATKKSTTLIAELM